MPTDVAEFAQGVIPFAYSRLDFLRREVRRRISTEGGFSDSLRALHYLRWGAQPNSTNERVNRRESAGVFQRVLHSVDHGSRAFANEVGIQLLAMSNLLG